MQKEVWNKWEPFLGLANIYDLKSFDIRSTGLVLKFKGIDVVNKRVFSMSFNEPIFMYKISEEMAHLQTLHARLEEKGLNSFGWAFFKITNSVYLQTLIAATPSSFQPEKFIHFVVIEMDSVIDIIGTKDPIVEWL